LEGRTNIRRTIRYQIRECERRQWWDVWTIDCLDQYSVVGELEWVGTEFIVGWIIGIVGLVVVK